jgi:methylase of polypeptide subunit release factors
MSVPWRDAHALLPELARLHAAHAGKPGEVDRLIVVLAEQAQAAAERTGDAAAREVYECFMEVVVFRLVLLSIGTPWPARLRSLDAFPELPSLRVVEGVFSPEYATDSYLWARHIVAQGQSAGRSVLEMGSGTGLIALYLLLHGAAASVTAVDVNPAAVENLVLNRALFGLDEARMPVIESDLFERVPESRYDLILWAMPWVHVDSPAAVEIVAGARDAVMRQWLRSVVDVRLDSVRRFITQSKSRLMPGGSVLLITSDFCRNDIIEAHARQEGFNYALELIATQEDVVPKLDMVLNLYQIRLTLV